MENKFYTPDLEDFHIGFEYEYKYNDARSWTKKVFGPDSFLHLDEIETKDFCRVKYLDREDIESLGWIREEFPMALRLFFTKEVDRFGVKETYSLLYVPQTSWVLIYKTQGYIIEHPDKITTTGTTVFAGEIKNKSELKRILKQVKL